MDKFKKIMNDVVLPLVSLVFLVLVICSTCLSFYRAGRQDGYNQGLDYAIDQLEEVQIKRMIN